MGLFSKKNEDLKEKKIDTEDSKKGEVYIEEIKKVDVEKDYPYIVQLNDIQDSTIVRRPPFGAKRYIEKANVFLVNEKVGFKEPFPQDNEEYKQFKIEELEEKIYDLEERIEKHRQKKLAKTPEYLDMIEELRVYKGFKKSLELSGKGSYVIISQEHGGRQLYTFDRRGNFKLPVFKNVDYSLIYVPNETDITLASELIELNNKENGNTDNSIKLANLAMLVLLILAFIALVYFAYKTSTMPETLTQGLTDLTNSQTVLTDKLTELYGGLENISNQITGTTPEPKVNAGKVNVNG